MADIGDPDIFSRIAEYAAIFQIVSENYAKREREGFPFALPVAANAVNKEALYGSCAAWRRRRAIQPKQQKEQRTWH